MWKVKFMSLSIIFIFCFFCSYPQTYSGKLVDMESDEPVAFANIGVIDRNIGTVSDAKGKFEIALDKRFDKDSLCISCIGYKSETWLISDFKKYFEPGEAKIKLSPIAYQLAEVSIQPGKTKNYVLGNHCDSNSAYGNAFYSEELGTEMGVIMKLPRKKEKARLKTFRFYVGEFTFDKFPVRLNIYSLKDGLPDKNILKEPIFIEIISIGEYITDLSKYSITLNDDFFISLEYYRIPEKTEGELVFCAVHSRRKNAGNSYYRWTSQGNWQQEMFDSVGFSVEVECED